MSTLRVAVQGCCHGELNTVYEALEREKEPVDLLIVGGDFQAIRNVSDLQCMSVPPKFKRLGDFAQYYNGTRRAPILTIFVGGNHEASNYLQELWAGGWVAPNIYFLGAAGVIEVGGLTVGGISGIWSKGDYCRGHLERLPFDRNTLRSVYHVRQFEVKKLLHFSIFSKEVGNSTVDVFLSHDWPRGIEQSGDVNQLIRKKPFFKAEIMRNDLGSPANEELLKVIKPDYWFSAHLHVKFEATIQHESEVVQLQAEIGRKRLRDERESPIKAQKQVKSLSGVETIPVKILNPEEIVLDLDEEDEEDAAKDVKGNVETSFMKNLYEPTQETQLASTQVESEIDNDIESLAQTQYRTTKFLALDKCLPRRQYLEILDIQSSSFGFKNDDGVLVMRHNLPWLAVTKAFSKYYSVSSYQQRLPQEDTLQAEIKTCYDELKRKVHSGELNLDITSNFETTAPVQSHDITERIKPMIWDNPQTISFCQAVGIVNPHAKERL